jgi:O-methyltransferase
VLPPIFAAAAHAVRRRIGLAADPRPDNLKDAEFYQPRFSPWLGLGDFKTLMAAVSPYSLVSADRIWVLHSLARQACHLFGNFWECGVYKGGTAILLKSVVTSASKKQLHLFDTFAGMPETDLLHDNYHRRGDFADTDLHVVRDRVGHDVNVHYHCGFIPDTFAGLEAERIAFAHIDVDIFQSVIDCCEFIYPRLSGGGFMVFDDYGFATCAGARRAVDHFFANRPECPLVLPTGQAVVIKLPREMAGPASGAAL